jgi:hypothetical protein
VATGRTQSGGAAAAAAAASAAAAELSWLLRVVHEGGGSEQARSLALVALEERHARLFPREPTGAWGAECCDAVRRTGEAVAALLEDRRLRLSWSKAQALASLTALLLALDAPRWQPALMCDLIALLWAVASKPNRHGWERARQIACASLREIELSFPCILADLAEDVVTVTATGRAGAAARPLDDVHSSPNFPFSLYQCAQLETSSVRESYLSLLLAVAQHASEPAPMVASPGAAAATADARLERERVAAQNWALDKLPGAEQGGASGDALRLQVELPQPPYNWALRPNVARWRTRLLAAARHGDMTDDALSAVEAAAAPLSLAAGVRSAPLAASRLGEVVSHAMNALPLMSGWARAEALGRSLAARRLVELPPELFRHHVSGFLRRRDALAVHWAVLTLRYVDGAAEADAVALPALLAVVDSAAAAAEVRALVCSWVSALARRRPAALFAHQRALLPRRADPLSVRAVRLGTLVASLGAVDARAARDGERVLGLVRDLVLAEAAGCFAHATVLPASAREHEAGRPGLSLTATAIATASLAATAAVVLRAQSSGITPPASAELAAALQLVAALLVRVPHLVTPAADLLCCTLLEHAHCAPQVATFVAQDGFRACQPETRTTLLERLASALATVAQPARLWSYLGLLHVLAREPSLAPDATVALALLRLARSPGAAAERHWDVGEALLLAAEEVLRHPLGAWHGPDDDSNLARLLRFVAARFQAPAARERASELLLLLRLPRDSALVVLRGDGAALAAAGAARPLACADFAPHIAKVMTSLPETALGRSLVLRRGLTLKDPPVSEDPGAQQRFIQIPLDVVLARPVECDERSYDRMLGLVLELSPCEHFETVPPLRLSFARVAPSADAAAAFPHGGRFILRLAPLRPAPARFKVRARFTAPDGSLFEGAAGEVRVATEDLLLPLPPPARSREAFAELWRARCGFRAARLVPLDRAEALQRLRASFRPFLLEERIGAEPDQDMELDWQLDQQQQQQKEGVDYTVFTAAAVVPPDFRLLFIASVARRSTLVRVATDRWELLAQVDTLLDHWLRPSAVVE